MHSSLFIFKFKLTFLSPFLGSFELKKRPLRITSIDSESFSIIDFKAVDPHIHVQGLVDGCEILYLLIHYEPWVEEKLPRLVDCPNSHSSVSAASDQLVYFLNINHV